MSSFAMPLYGAEAQRARLRFPITTCAALATTLDLAVAFAWWSAEGVPPGDVLRAIAAWTLGSATYEWGHVAAAWGLIFYFALICVVAAGYRWISGHSPAMRRAPFACGALYGLVAYLLWFGTAVPALTGRNGFGPPEWALLCGLAWMFLIGVPCALLAGKRPPARR